MFELLFTNEERKFFYKELLKMVCEDPNTRFGFCWYVLSLSIKLGGKYKKVYEDSFTTIILIKYEYPELWSIRPKNLNFNDYWFPRTSKG